MAAWRIGRRDRHIVILVFIIVLVAAVLLGTRGISVFDAKSYAANLIIYASVVLLYVALRTLKITVVERPEKLIASILEREFSRSQRQRLWDALPVLLSLVIFMPAFSALKSAIPLLNAFSWDGYFIDLDIQIHGMHAWQLIHPAVGYPLVTAVLALLYHLWVVLIYAGSIFFAFYGKDAALRQRYFLAYFLSWSFVGALLATVFSSVGPCFVEPIVGRDDFAPLMQYLNEANRHYPIMVLDVQNLLLTEYHNAAGGLGRGITAMPSMHVSLAFLFFLAMRHVSRAAAWAFGIFFAAILIGSVHLAYHYAVDVYVSIIVTAAIWKLAGWWSARTGGFAGGQTFHDERSSRNEAIYPVT